MTSHLLLGGGWAKCEAGDACQLKFHVDLEPEALTQLPEPMMEQLTETLDPPTRVRGGIKEWLNAAGGLHRDYDLPAYIDTVTGARMWYLHGELHRGGDKPANVQPRGTRSWYSHGKLHRGDDLPAIEWEDGTLQWFWRGLQHRGGDKPAVVKPNGDQEWWEHGQLHREHDLPAVVAGDGEKLWYRRGELHRPQAPAMIFANGEVRWFVLGLAASPWQALGLAPFRDDEPECNNCRKASRHGSWTHAAHGQVW